MTIVLNHTIVPARDKAEAARFFARIFGLKTERVGYFAPVRINDQTTLLFNDSDSFDSRHYAFRERPNSMRFSIASRRRGSSMAATGDPADGKLNDWGGGRASISPIPTATPGADDRAAVTEPPSRYVTKTAPTSSHPPAASSADIQTRSRLIQARRRISTPIHS